LKLATGIKITPNVDVNVLAQSNNKGVIAWHALAVAMTVGAHGRLTLLRGGATEPHSGRHHDPDFFQ
jgi:hypothetical protein